MKIISVEQVYTKRFENHIEFIEHFDIVKLFCSTFNILDYAKYKATSTLKDKKVIDVLLDLKNIQEMIATLVTTEYEVYINVEFRGTYGFEVRVLRNVDSRKPVYV